jgi:glutamate synthase (NADPH/NADH) small chain
MQIEVLSRPSDRRTPEFPWPRYPVIFKTSSSHEEGGERQWAVLTKKFTGKEGTVKKAHCVRLDPSMKEMSGTEFEIEADLVILAIGFLHPEHNGLLNALKVKFDPRGNVKTDENYMTSRKGVFSAGDMRRGQSLVVWAIAEGRRCAHNIDKYLMGESFLPNV